MRMASLPTIVSRSSHEQRSRSRPFSSGRTRYRRVLISRQPIAPVRALTIPFEVWKRPDELGRAIAGSRGGTAPGGSGRCDDDRRALRLLPDEGRRRGGSP